LCGPGSLWLKDIFMKRILLYLLFFTPISVLADNLTSGFYRVQNASSQRYLSIVDNRSQGVDSQTQDGDLELLKLINEDVFSNPATVCYFNSVGNSNFNLSGQDLNLFNATGQYLAVYNYGSYHWMYASAGTAGLSVTKYLIEVGDDPFPHLGGANGKRDWTFSAVDQSDNSYFGVKPDVQVDGKNWATQYAGFGFAPSNSNMKVYRVEVKNDKAVIFEITGDIPMNTPVLILCGSDSPIGNKLTLKKLDSSSVGNNDLVGNFYYNENDDMYSGYNHQNRTAYNPSTMRMLGTTSDGKLGFVTSTIDYLPANKCYLKVSDSAPAELKIMTEEEYIAGVEELTTDVNNSPKVIYDLQGRRVTAPSKGLYIVNGKKAVIK